MFNYNRSLAFGQFCMLFTVIALIIPTLLAAVTQQQQHPKTPTSPDIQTNEDLFVEPNGTVQLKCQLSPAILFAHTPSPSAHNAATAADNALYQWRFIPTEAPESRRGREISLATLGASGEWKAYDEFTITGQRRRGEFNLDITRVQYAQNDGDYYCEINMPGGQVYQSAKSHVYVKYAPEPPVIEYTGVGAKSMKEGDKLVISCATAGGNPAPQINWYKGSKRLDNVEVKLATTRHGDSVARLAIDPLDKEHNGVQYKCLVNNVALRQPLEIETPPLDVKYKPRVTVQGFVLDKQNQLTEKGPFSPLEIERGTPYKLTCKADANPPLTGSPYWRRDGKIVHNNSYNITYTSLSTDQQQQQSGPMECVVANTIGEASEQIDIHVFYAPEVELSPRLSTVKEGEKNTFDCTVKSNPSVSSTAVKWYRGSQEVATGRHLELSDIHRSQAGEYRCRAQNRFRTSGSNGTTITRESEASGRLIVQYRPGTAAIQASLSTSPAKSQLKSEDDLSTSSDVSENSADATVALNGASIAAAPKLSAVPRSITALLGAQVSLWCTTDEPGVPLATYRWTKKGDPGFRTTGQYLNFSSGVTLTDNGEYECMPSNEVGDGTAQTIQLVVNEPVRFIEAASSLSQRTSLSTDNTDDSIKQQPEPIVQSIDNNQPLSLECTARGRPAPVIEWLRNGRPITNTESNFPRPPSQTNGKFRIVTDEPSVIDTVSYVVHSELRFEGEARKDLFNGAHRLSRTDRGIYTCRARGAGPAREYSRTVLIQYAPELRNQFSRAATTLTDSVGNSTKNVSSEARIPCLIEARPSPSVSWSRNGLPILAGGGDDRFSVLPLVAVDEETYRSELLIRPPVTRSDLGDYVCSARNMIGEEKKFTIALTERSRPFNPTSLEASQVFSSSLLLRWTPGFDGGYDQRFSVFVKEESSPPRPQQQLEATNLVDDDESTKSLRILHPTVPSSSANWLLLTGLKSDTKYAFWVRSENDLGPSIGRSNKVHVKTHQAPVESVTVPPPTSVQFDPSLSLVRFDVPTWSTVAAGKRESSDKSNRVIRSVVEDKPPPLCAQIEILLARQDDWSTVAECYDSFVVSRTSSGSGNKTQTSSGAFEIALLQDDFIQLGKVENVRVRMCLAQAPPTSCSKPTYWRDEPMFGASRIAAGGLSAGSTTALAVVLSVAAALALLAVIFFVCRSRPILRHFKKYKSQTTPADSAPVNSGNLAAHFATPPIISSPTAFVAGGAHSKLAESNGIYGYQIQHTTGSSGQQSPLQQQYYDSNAENINNNQSHHQHHHSTQLYGQSNGEQMFYDDAHQQQQHEQYHSSAYPQDVYQAYSGAIGAYPVQVLPQPNGLPPATMYYNNNGGVGDEMMMNGEEMQANEQQIPGGTIVVDENGQELLIDDDGNYHPLNNPNMHWANQHQQQNWHGDNVHNLGYYPMDHHQYNNDLNAYNSLQQQQQQQLQLQQMNGLPDPYDDDAATFLTHVPGGHNNIVSDGSGSSNLISMQGSNNHVNAHQLHHHISVRTNNGVPAGIAADAAAQQQATTLTTPTTTIKTPLFGEISDESGYSTSASRSKRVVREIVV